MTDRLDPDRLDELWDFSDPSASADRFDEATVSGPIEAAELRTQYARALGLAGRRDEADQVLAAIQSDDPVVSIRVALEKGRRLNSDGFPADAVPFFEAAWELARGEGAEFLAVDAAHMLAIADAAHEQEWATRGIAVADASLDPRVRRWAIALHNNLGWLHHDQDRFTEALAEFELADAAARTYGTEEQQQIAQWTIARAYRSLGRIQDAIEIQQRLAVLRPDDEYVLEELGLLSADEA